MRPHGLGPSATRVSTLAMENENLINLQDFEQNEIPLKQRSFEDSIDTFLSLFDADLLLIWMKKFRHGFRFRSASCPVLHIMLIISRGECIYRYQGIVGICFIPKIFLTFSEINSKPKGVIIDITTRNMLTLRTTFDTYLVHRPVESVLSSKLL